MKFKFSIKLATISLIGNIIIAIGVSTCRIFSRQGNKGS